MLDDEENRGMSRTYLSPTAFVKSWRRESDGKQIHQGMCTNHERSFHTPPTADPSLAMTNLKLHRLHDHGEAHKINEREVGQ
jgi:hypothetical protein